MSNVYFWWKWKGSHEYPLPFPKRGRQVLIKTPNLIYRFYGCLIESEEEEDSQSCWYFQPASWTIAPLTFSLVSSPPLPVWISILYTSIQCVRGEYGVIGGEGPPTDKTPAAKSLYRSIWTFGIAFYQSYLSTEVLLYISLCSSFALKYTSICVHIPSQCRNF